MTWNYTTAIAREEPVLLAARTPTEISRVLVHLYRVAEGRTNPLDATGLGISVSLKCHLSNRIELTFTFIATTSAIDIPPLVRTTLR